MLKLEPIATRVEKYFASPDVNNSLLNLCFKPKWLQFKLENRDTEDEEKKAFTVGSAIDSMFTNPTVFDDQFYVWTHARPPGLMAKFVDALPLDLDDLNEEEKEAALHTAYVKSGYKKKKEAVLAAFESEEYMAYYRARVNSMGKKILSIEMLDEINNAAEALAACPVAKNYFAEMNTNPDIEIIHQFPLYQKLGAYHCKGLLDIVVFDHKAKTIKGVDLKSVGKSPELFEDSFYDYAYYRQFAFYQTMMRMWLDSMQAIGAYSDYTLLNFEAIIAPKKDFGCPALVYEIDDSLISLGMHGGHPKSRPHQHYRGIYELLTCLDFHITTRNFTSPKWIIDADYKIKLT